MDTIGTWSDTHNVRFGSRSKKHFSGYLSNLELCTVVTQSIETTRPDENVDPGHMPLLHLIRVYTVWHSIQQF